MSYTDPPPWQNSGGVRTISPRSSPSRRGGLDAPVSFAKILVFDFTYTTTAEIGLEMLTLKSYKLLYNFLQVTTV